MNLGISSSGMSAILSAASSSPRSAAGRPPSSPPSRTRRRRRPPRRWPRGLRGDYNIDIHFSTLQPLGNLRVQRHRYGRRRACGSASSIVKPPASPAARDDPPFAGPAGTLPRDGSRRAPPRSPLSDGLRPPVAIADASVAIAIAAARSTAAATGNFLSQAAGKAAAVLREFASSLPSPPPSSSASPPPPGGASYARRSIRSACSCSSRAW